MIDINLLPPEFRKRKSPPVGWILFALTGILVAVLALLGAWRYKAKVIPLLTARLGELRTEEAMLLVKTGELEHAAARISELERHVETMIFMYNRRIIWSRFLQDVKQVVTALNKPVKLIENVEEVDSFEDADPNLVWLTRVAGYGRTLYLDGKVDAPTREKAEETAAALIDGLRNSVPPTYAGSSDDGGLASAPLRQLMAEGWPRLSRVEPVSVKGAGQDGGAGTFDFAIEVLLR